MSSQDLSPRQFAALPSGEQLEVLSRSGNRQRLEYLQEVSHAERLMAKMPVQEVLLLLKESGAEHLAELAGMASPEQWTGFFDLDCWSGDVFDAQKSRHWLQLLLQGDVDRVVPTLQEMNFETLVLLLKKEIEIITGPESLEDDDQRAEAMKRDGGYQITYRDEDGAKIYETLLNFLFRNEPDFCRYLLEAVRGETVSLVEESVYQQRSLRLNDLGFPDIDTVLSVYARIETDNFCTTGEQKVPIGAGDFEVSTGLAPALVLPEGFLAQVLSEMMTAEISWELTSLVNKVALADRIDLGDPEQMRQVVEKVYGTLNLAVEALSEEDLVQARQLLASHYCEELFRYGYSLTLRLQRRAHIIRRSSIVPYLDHDATEGLTALEQTPPLLADVVGKAGLPGRKLFSKRGEVEVADTWLTQYEALAEFFDTALPSISEGPESFITEGCLPDDPSQLTLTHLFLTAMANQLLDGDFLPVPLAESRLADLHRLVSVDGQFAPQLRQRLLEGVAQQTPGIVPFIEQSLDLFSDEFCRVRVEDLDPRFLGGLIIKSVDSLTS